MGTPSGGRSFEFTEGGSVQSCPGVVFDIGPHLVEVLLALVAAISGGFAAYKANQNHGILKNGGVPHA